MALFPGGQQFGIQDLAGDNWLMQSPGSLSGLWQKQFGSAPGAGVISSLMGGGKVGGPAGGNYDFLAGSNAPGGGGGGGGNSSVGMPWLTNTNTSNGGNASGGGGTSSVGMPWLANNGGGAGGSTSLNTTVDPLNVNTVSTNDSTSFVPTTMANNNSVVQGVPGDTNKLAGSAQPDSFSLAGGFHGDRGPDSINVIGEGDIVGSGSESESRVVTGSDVGGHRASRAGLNAFAEGQQEATLGNTLPPGVSSVGMPWLDNPKPDVDYKNIPDGLLTGQDTTSTRRNYFGDPLTADEAAPFDNDPRFAGILRKN